MALSFLVSTPGLVVAQDTPPLLPSLAESPKNLTLLSVTSATVAPHGLAFGSLSFTSKREGVFDEWDGSMAFGVGFGSAEDTVGVQLTAQVTSLTDEFGDSGYFDLKLSRQVSRGNTPVYLGAQVSSFATWGDANVNPVSGKVMVTWFPTLTTSGGQAFPLMFTAGVGSHLRNNFTDPAGYFGAGIGLSRNFGASASWTGETLDIGTSILFDSWKYGNVTAEINDVTDRLGQRRFSISLNIFNPSSFGG